MRLRLLLATLLTALPAAADEPPAAGPAPLSLQASVDGLRIRARLQNRSSQPLQVLVGSSCSGPDPFQLLVDDRMRPFATTARLCQTNDPVYKTLEPSQAHVVLSDALDGRNHKVAVRYRTQDGAAWIGEVFSEAIDVLGIESLQISLHAPARTQAGKLSIEIVHRNIGLKPVRVLTRDACGQPTHDVLIIDGQEQRLGGNCSRGGRGTQVLGVSGSFVSTVTIDLQPGLHQIAARYAVPGTDVKGLPPLAGIATWAGALDSPVRSVEAGNW